MKYEPSKISFIGGGKRFVNVNYAFIDAFFWQRIDPRCLSELELNPDTNYI